MYRAENQQSLDCCDAALLGWRGNPDNELVPGVFIFRPEASLMYFNNEHVINRFKTVADAIDHFGTVK